MDAKAVKEIQDAVEQAKKLMTDIALSDDTKHVFSSIDECDAFVQVLAVAIYRARKMAELAATKSGFAPSDKMIAEWALKEAIEHLGKAS